ncbi:hypothetical protein ABWH92_12350 [Ahrensia marina]|uniref:hypothetical protein n=1 Tax=Ahrensia marina TaxID=1514904 RepID=UPI0035D00882
MSNLYPVAGAKIWMSTAPVPLPTDDVTASTFSGVTYVEIDGWETMGAYGDSAELITTQLINRGRDIKQKGTRNAGSMENNFAIVDADPGQTQLIAAEATRDNYAFKIEYDDAPASGSAPTPSRDEFIGLVMGAPKQGGGANTVRMISSTIEINSNLLFTAAATGD